MPHTRPTARAMILTSDWHLTDNPADEYRWAIFDELARLLAKEKDKWVYMLGDLTDRKDRHSAELVNRVVYELTKLSKLASVVVLMGNHDKPIAGTPFWQFLDKTNDRLRFITQPIAQGDLLLLPYSDDPRVEWRDLPMDNYRCAFMHQTVTGAIGNNGHALENNKMPIFPRGLRIYSGDIHTPQIVRRVTYVGAPHPVAFGDDYPCRVLVLDADYAIKREVALSPMQKRMIRVSSLDELDDVETRKDDQARVIYKLSVNDIDRWPALQEQIASWALLRQITLASIEPDIAGTSALADAPDALADSFDLAPEVVLRMFAEAEDIDKAMLEAGLAFIKETAA